MELTAYAIGTRMPAWVSDGVNAYSKRLPRHIKLAFRELPSGAKNSADVKRAEGERILAALPEQSHVIALDEHGKSCTSMQLAEQLERWLANEPRVSFLIGGADGLADECLQRADKLWSLSTLTLPHALVRVVLAEQIYRAWTVTTGHPYHRE